MENTTYSELISSFYSKIKSYDFIKMDEGDAFNVVKDYIRPSIVLFKGCKQQLKDRNDKLQEFNFNLNDQNFEILVNYMIIVYLDSEYIRTPSALKATMSNTDFHKYDNKDMLGKALEVRALYKKENDQLMINYSYEGSKLFDTDRIGKI